jgi:uncharacterized protein YggU (UPF0235/DUF167 family)
LPDSPLSPAADGVRLRVRLTPRAREQGMIAVVAAAAEAAVKAAVTAPAEGGRANEALLRLLAREWRLPRHDLAILAGETSRSKLVGSAGDPERLAARLGPMIAALPRR